MRGAGTPYPTPPLFFRRSLSLSGVENPLNDMTAGAVSTAAYYNEYPLWRREEQLIKELRDNRHRNIIVSRTRICSNIYTYKFSKLYIRQKQTLCTFSCSASFDI